MKHVLVLLPLVGARVAAHAESSVTQEQRRGGSTASALNNASTLPHASAKGLAAGMAFSF